MGITHGFFNSENGDRTYTAEDFNKYLSGLISDGVFESIGDRLKVTAAGEMTVKVGSGRAMINSHWIENDSELTLEIEPSAFEHRYDRIVAQHNEALRTVRIIVKKGSSEGYPELENSGSVKELCLAKIRVNAGSTSLTQVNITDTRGSSECPWVTGLIDQVYTADLFDQYKAAYENYFDSAAESFERWFNNLTSDLAVLSKTVKYSRTMVAGNEGDVFAIGIPEYEDGDILMVNAGGRLLIEGIDYERTSSYDVAQIAVDPPIDPGTIIEISVIKSVCDRDADIPPPTYQTKTISPTTQVQTITADEGFDALSQVEVSAVTSSIDSNIKAANIKNDVTILGVKGTYVSAGHADIVLSPVSGKPGEKVAVPLGIYSNSICKAWTLSVEFDQALKFNRVGGGASYSLDDGILYISAWNGNSGFPDSAEPHITIEFWIPDAATAGSKYHVNISEVENLDYIISGQTGSLLPNYNTVNTFITVDSTGTQGNYQIKTVTPTTSAQTITADNGYDALSEVTVNAVTSSIDSNIKAANIKSGTTILGVKGTYSSVGICVISLDHVSGKAGEEVKVPIRLFANNKCTGYTIGVKFDTALTFKRVSGGASYSLEGDVIYLSGFTSKSYFPDDSELVYIHYVIPSDAIPGQTYTLECAEKIAQYNKQDFDVVYGISPGITVIGE